MLILHLEIFWKNMKQLIIYLIFLAAICSCTSCNDGDFTHIECNGVYYWKTVLELRPDDYRFIDRHNVDRIYLRPEILDEAAVPAPLGFDVNKYINTTFRMYNAPRREVELVCDNGVMDAIIDRFGPDVETYACDQQNFRVIAEIAVGKIFFNWIFGFDGKVRIKAPEDVKQQYKEQILKAMEIIDK